MTPRRLLFVLAFFGLSSTALIKAQTPSSNSSPLASPLAVKASGVGGTVVVKCRVSKLGKAQNAHAISGPSELWKAAVDAVSNYQYKPAHHFGRLVEVDLTVAVNFSKEQNQAAMGLTEQLKADHKPQDSATQSIAKQ